jgi:hypothetical protein
MDAAELAWRGRAATRTLGQHLRCAVVAPRWNRRQLARLLAPDTGLDRARTALRRGDWSGAHRELSQQVASRQSRFVIAPERRPTLVAEIARAFPGAASDAAERADRVVAGEYDLLGYRALRFSDGPDWHYDPVHRRHAPRRFWASVPYLDPVCGDHKIIWELNRHQHWLALGRGYWLTGASRYRDRFVHELSSWVEANPPLIGINWASMLELGLRSLSWVWALMFFAGASEELDSPPWSVDLLLALDRQLTHIEHNLSCYFSPNTHLLGEALALYVSGRALPELAGSERRAAVGRRTLVAEMGRQIARDGGHCERSTHYHRYTLDFYLLALAIARITRDPVEAAFAPAVVSLASAARILADDHGSVPHIGDDDGGLVLPIAGRRSDDWRDSLAVAASLTGRDALRIGAPPEEAFWMLAHPALQTRTISPAASHAASHAADEAIRVPSSALDDTGYYVSRSSGEHIVIDGGPHGYRNAGHAHADALSLTLSVRGRPLLIDPGTACYTIDPVRRDRFRTTALHNTLLLDGRPQSVASGPFQWSRSASSTTHRWRSTGAFDYFDGSHDGYAPARHRRRALMLHGDMIVVADLVTDPGPAREVVLDQRGQATSRVHTASVRWHIGPEWKVAARDRSLAMTACGERIALLVPHGPLEVYSGDEVTGLGWHSPVYGSVEPATTVCVTHRAKAPFWMVSVFDLNPADPVEDVEALSVWAEAGALTEATGIKISRHDSVAYALFAEPAHGRGAMTSSWRIAAFETDARMLFCRVNRRGDPIGLALVDGSIVRSDRRRLVCVATGCPTPALYLDEPRIRSYTVCAASPAS